MPLFVPLLLIAGNMMAPVQLAHVFKAGTTLNYHVDSHLATETRRMGFDTWMPEELDLLYDFKLKVLKEKADGIAEVRYQRPTMTQILGETFDTPPVKSVQPIDYDFQLTLSPVNDVLDIKNLSKKAAGVGGQLSLIRAQGDGDQDLMGSLMDEVYRLALFAGNFESALDLAPRLPTDEATPGMQWKRTAGYSPQKLQGTAGKSVVQRLDYTYTYKGPMQSNGKPVQRVVADLVLDTDVAPFVHQVTGLKPFQTKLKSLKLNLKAHIEFDLDPVTFDTLEARAVSTGGFAFVHIARPGRPDLEERLKGRTTLRLVSKK